MSEKIYRVQMNSNGMPNFSTAVEIADRPQGKWIYIDEPIIGNPYGRYKCSECNLVEPFESDFCPNCGCRMKGADDDTIDAGALINRIVFYTDLSHDVKESVEDEIENAPTVSQWIPCSERLPKVEENPVLVTSMGLVGMGWYRNGDWLTSTNLPFFDVVAWMPLPEPYRKENQ